MNSISFSLADSCFAPVSCGTAAKAAAADADAAAAVAAGGTHRKDAPSELLPACDVEGGL